MIRMLGFNTRKEGISKEEFDRHRWEIHAPLALKTHGPLRYVHYYILGKRPNRQDVAGPTIEIDGFSELWFKDMAAYERYFNSPETRELLADGASYMGTSGSYIVEKRVVFDRWLD